MLCWDNDRSAKLRQAEVTLTQGVFISSSLAQTLIQQNLNKGTLQVGKQYLQVGERVDKEGKEGKIFKLYQFDARSMDNPVAVLKVHNNHENAKVCKKN